MDPSVLAFFMVWSDPSLFLLTVAGTLAGIYVGADSMSRAINVPTYIADVIVATCVLSVLVSLMLTRFRVRLR